MDKVTPSKGSLEDINCYFLLGKTCTLQTSALYQATFLFWKNVLVQALKDDAKETDVHYSDEFMRQEIVCLTYKDAPIGIFMFDWFDLALASHREHSYFRHYPPFVVEQLQLSHSQMMTMGNLTIAPSWRKSNIGFGISEVLLGLATKRFLASSASALITFTRNNRKTHELVYRHGGVPLLQGHMSHGHESDIIAIYRDTVTPTSVAGIPELVELFWQNKINLVPENYYCLETGAASSLLYDPLKG